MRGKGSRLGLTPDEYKKYRNKKKRDRYKEAQHLFYKWNRTSILKKKYGISWSDYEEMYERQEGRCAICKKEEDDRSLAIDHCHTTGKVRGLLCGSCNRALGLLKDDPELIEQAKEYVLSAIAS
jgi:hypothetical protein